MSTGASPWAMRRAITSTLAASIGLPADARWSAARTAASNPLSVLARANTRNAPRLAAAPIPSSASRNASGTSPRIGLSPHARVMRTNAGRTAAGSRTVPDASPYARGRPATFLPSPVRISTSNARNPTSSRHPRHDGPARYLCPSTATTPSLSALRDSHSTASNRVRGNGAIASRSSPNRSETVLPSR